MSKRYLVALFAVAAIAAAQGCGGEGGAAKVECEKPELVVVYTLTDALNFELESGDVIRPTLRGLSAVKSNDYDDVWMLAADIQTSKLQRSDDLAVWATNDIESPSEFFAVDEFARESSSATDGSDRFSATSHGVEEAKQCARDRLGVESAE